VGGFLTLLGVIRSWENGTARRESPQTERDTL
jgi:hypothetical protein